jgi:hypothetical protein
MHLAGVILDIYDDAAASTCTTKLAAAGGPETVLLSQDELSRLPDRMFALVAENGGETVRKYAMHDSGHLVTSVAYFLTHGHLLPDYAQKTAARNLVGACEWYGLEPMPELLKLAGISGVIDAAGHLANVPKRLAAGQEASKTTMDGFRAAQAGLTSDMQQKRADLNGTEMMPVSGHLSQWPHPRNTAKPTAGSATMKKASWERCEDLTRHVPREKVAQRARTFALPSLERYPLDQYDHVKQASVYFDEYYADFPLDERREFAVNLATRLESLGLPLGDATRKYAGFEYGPHISSELAARVRNFDGTGHEHAYTVLMEKKASTPPGVMVEMLAELDKRAGADAYYNRPLGFRDPYQATFGKYAKNEMWSWSEGNDYVNSDMLKSLATNKWQGLDDAFGADFRKSFQKDPVGIFESLPTPQKIVLARMAPDKL